MDWAMVTFLIVVVVILLSNFTKGKHLGKIFNVLFAAFVSHILVRVLL